MRTWSAWYVLQSALFPYTSLSTRLAFASGGVRLHNKVAFKGCVTVYGWAAEQAKDCRQEAQHARAVLTVEDVSDL